MSGGIWKRTWTVELALGANGCYERHAEIERTDSISDGSIYSVRLPVDEGGECDLTDDEVVGLIAALGEARSARGKVSS